MQCARRLREWARQTPPGEPATKPCRRYARGLVFEIPRFARVPSNLSAHSVRGLGFNKLRQDGSDFWHAAFKAWHPIRVRSVLHRRFPGFDGWCSYDGRKLERDRAAVISSEAVCRQPRGTMFWNGGMAIEELVREWRYSAAPADSADTFSRSDRLVERARPEDGSTSRGRSQRRRHRSNSFKACSFAIGMSAHCARLACSCVGSNFNIDRRWSAAAGAGLWRKPG